MSSKPQAKTSISFLSSGNTIVALGLTLYIHTRDTLVKILIWTISYISNPNFLWKLYSIWRKVCLYNFHWIYINIIHCYMSLLQKCKIVVSEFAFICQPSFSIDISSYFYFKTAVIYQQLWSFLPLCQILCHCVSYSHSKTHWRTTKKN